MTNNGKCKVKLINGTSMDWVIEGIDSGTMKDWRFDTKIPARWTYFSVVEWGTDLFGKEKRAIVKYHMTKGDMNYKFEIRTSNEGGCHLEVYFYNFAVGTMPLGYTMNLGWSPDGTVVLHLVETDGVFKSIGSESLPQSDPDKLAPKLWEMALTANGIADDSFNAGAKEIQDFAQSGAIKVFCGGYQDINAAFVYHNETDVVLCFRGTKGEIFADILLDLWADAADKSKANFDTFIHELVDLAKLDFGNLNAGVDFKGHVHRGFYNGFETIIGNIYQYVQPLLLQPSNKRFYITGHSKGGALATLAALYFFLHHYPPTEVVTFAAARVGDADFVADYNRKITKHTSYESYFDIVPHLPLSKEEADLYPIITGLYEACEAKIPELISKFIKFIFNLEVYCTVGQRKVFYIPANSSPRREDPNIEKQYKYGDIIDNSALPADQFKQIVKLYLDCLATIDRLATVDSVSSSSFKPIEDLFNDIHINDYQNKFGHD